MLFINYYDGVVCESNIFGEFGKKLDISINDLHLYCLDSDGKVKLKTVPSVGFCNVLQVLSDVKDKTIPMEATTGEDAK